MKIGLFVAAVGLLCCSSVPSCVSAQTTTGSNTSISLPTPPRSMTSLPVASTPGSDSTYQGNVAPNLTANSTISVPWTYSGSSGSAAAVAAPAASQQSRALPKPRQVDPATHP